MLETDELLPAARVVASCAYTLKTLTLHDDALIAVVSGCKRLYMPGQTLETPAGSGVLIARGTQWDISNDPQGSRHYYQALAVQFPPSLLRDFAADGPVPVIRSAQVLPMDQELLQALQRTLPPTTTTTFTPRLLRHRLLELLLLLAERGWHFAPTTELSWPERIRRLVAQRPQADWDVATLASMFHLSESSLRRRLDGAGLTLAALVREVRLETALALLQSTQLSVGAVAQHCGWQSHSRFSAVFQARWGVPPSKVRAQLKESGQALLESG